MKRELAKLLNNQIEKEIMNSTQKKYGKQWTRIDMKARN